VTLLAILLIFFVIALLATCLIFCDLAGDIFDIFGYLLALRSCGCTVVFAAALTTHHSRSRILLPYRGC
jgi:hypothetical protein